MESTTTVRDRPVFRQSFLELQICNVIDETRP
jgi:hypothetical protein